MSLTRFPHGISSYGIPLLGGQGLTMPGKAYFVDALYGSDGNDGLDISRPFSTIAYARTFLTDKKNDTLYMIGSSTDFTMSSAHVWNKSYTHMVGLAAPVQTGERTCLGNLASGTPKVTISGNGCIFSNFMSKHGGVGTSTGNYINVTVSGSNNYFWNVNFCGPLDSSTGASAYRELNVGATSDNYFEKCSFGQMAVNLSATAGYEVAIGAIAGNVVFTDCLFLTYASDSSHCIVGASANFASEAALLLFNRCLFIQGDASVTLVKVVDTPAAANGMVLFHQCGANLATDWADKTANVFVTMATSAEAGGIGTPPA